MDVLTDNSTTVAYINKDSVPHLVLPGTGPMGLVQATWNPPGCHPHIGGQERPGGRPVVPPQESGTADLRALADPSCGSLRVGEKPQTSGVLLGTPLSDVERDKRSDAKLGESVRVSVPADKPHSEGTEEIEAAVVSPDPPSSPVLVQPAVVPSADQRMITPKDNLLKNSVTGMFYPKPDRMRLAVWRLSANPLLTEDFHRELQRRQPGPGENRLAGFMIPVFSTTDDGAWSEVWVPLRPL